jgi:hypothetical protein
MNPLQFTLTRYLYPKHNVEQSLIWAILDGEMDEAQYWAYELYYSGFRTEIFDLCIAIYNTFYQVANAHIHPLLYNILDKWYRQEKERKTLGKKHLYQDILLGEMIKQLVSIKPTLIAIMRYRIGLPYEEIQNSWETDNTFSIGNTHQTEYKTNDEISWKTLSHVLKYPIRNMQCDLASLEDGIPEPTLEYLIHILRCDLRVPEDIRANWLYYASRSPVWKTRITKHQGNINDADHTICFPENMHDIFYDSYNYELDEQPRSVFECLYGGNHDVITWQEFYDRYSHNTIVDSTKPHLIHPSR